MAPCFFMGLYPFGRPPSHSVVRLPDCALAPFSANLDVPLFFSIAVTNLAVNARWPVFQDWLPPEYRPHSRSAWTHGPLPEQPPNQHSVLKLMASMAPAASAFRVVSLLP